MKKNNKPFPQRHGKSVWVECPPDVLLVTDEQEATDLVGLCGEHDTVNLLLFHSNLHPDFFDLRTGLAGAVTQKFSNYSIRAVIILDADREYGERFLEWARESNRGRFLRFVYTREEALDFMMKS